MFFWKKKKTTVTRVDGVHVDINSLWSCRTISVDRIVLSLIIVQTSVAFSFDLSSCCAVAKRRWVLVRSLSSPPKVHELRVRSVSSKTLGCRISTRPISRLVTLQRIGSSSVLGFVPSCCGWILGSTSRDGLTMLGPSSRDGWTLLGFGFRCAPSSAASSPLELLQGFSGAGEVVALSLWLSGNLPCVLGVSRGSFHCVELLASLHLSERGFLVATDGLNYFGPELTNLGLSADVMTCLFAQDPVAHSLIRRCESSILVCLYFFLFWSPDLSTVSPWNFEFVNGLQRWISRAPHGLVASEIREPMRMCLFSFRSPFCPCAADRLARENFWCFSTNDCCPAVSR